MSDIIAAAALLISVIALIMWIRTKRKVDLLLQRQSEARASEVEAPAPNDSSGTSHAGAAQSKQETGYVTAYMDFARNLRTWLIAYGIGAPVLMVSQDTVAQAIAASPHTRAIVNCFLGGVGIQVVMALVYKIVMWYLYLGELHPKLATAKRYTWSDWLSEQLWVELIADLITLFLFGYATIQIVYIVTAELPVGSVGSVMP